jgi:hypothetical protein
MPSYIESVYAVENRRLSRRYAVEYWLPVLGLWVVGLASFCALVYGVAYMVAMIWTAVS